MELSGACSAVSPQQDAKKQIMFDFILYVSFVCVFLPLMWNSLVHDFCMLSVFELNLKFGFIKIYKAIYKVKSVD